MYDPNSLTIVDALSREINENQETIRVLSRVEFDEYSNAGATVFKETPPEPTPEPAA